MIARTSRIALNAAAALALAATSAVAGAAPGDWVKAITPIPTPDQQGAIDLPVTLKRDSTAHEAWAQQQPGQRLVYNVNRPQLIALPGSLPADATAPAVLLVPGGGFQFLAMDNEGFDVAKRLDKQGVRVFIVKYRTLPVADSFAGFHDAVTQSFVNGLRPSMSDQPYAVADVQAAIRMVRANAAQWHVDPAKIGILGFSAGAMTVYATLRENAADARADFAGMIYGPTAGTSADVPPHAPPLFAAIAADDRFFKAQDLSLIHAWRSSGSSVELHLYSGGGHGFASHPNGTTSDAWFDQFALWLKDTGVLPRT